RLCQARRRRQRDAGRDRQAGREEEGPQIRADVRPDALTMTAAADLTLDELRIELAPAIARAAIFDGWSDAALANAGAAKGVDPAVARLAFPGGASDMIAAWIAAVDARMEQAFDREVLAQMPIRERIRALVWFRLEAVTGLEEALRRSLAIQAMPQNLARTARLAWRSADAMWR